ncbi:hypothetical protein BD769DRAFT_1674238 [Suillus cothurnatus]|nr:hypothetical protein BD769DRAFT_1674238 [Suillus cothurnatus]
MTVLHCLRAERELQFQAQDQCHTQQAALAVEASLEAGSTFDTMDQFYDSESLMQRSDGSDGDMDSVAAWTSHSSALTPILRERQQSSMMDFPFFSPYTVFRGNGNSVARWTSLSSALILP